MNKLLFCAKCCEKTEHVKTDVYNKGITSTVMSFNWLNPISWITKEQRNITVYRCVKCGGYNSESDEELLD